MAVLLASLVVFLAMIGHSNAAYCICKDGVKDNILQENIDYACGQGADCTPIHQGGNCFNPDTVKDHCNYAVNSYYQRKSSTGATCDFSGTATLVQALPNANSGCSYPSSASNAGTATPNNPSTNPSIAPPGSSSTNPITTPTGGTTPGFNGLGPSGSGGLDNPGSGARQGPGLFVSLAFVLAILGVNCFRV